MDFTFELTIEPEPEDPFLKLGGGSFLSEDSQDLVGKWCHIRTASAFKVWAWTLA